uniref:Uncharacterized protein n=1 Tax=Avena sativa TaxID=4498 RepID=A0ACD5WCN2_AVESA
MNSRPIVLIFLLLVLIITSQFEWKQQIGEAEASPEATRRRQQALVLREDAVKEKVSSWHFVKLHSLYVSIIGSATVISVCCRINKRVGIWYGGIAHKF